MSIKVKLEVNELLNIFELQHCRDQHPKLQDWLSSTGTLSATDEVILKDMIDETRFRIEGWNEEELKMKVVALLFYLSHIKIEGKIDIFYERNINSTINNYNINVIADCTIGTVSGITKVQNPYFFFQEFKKSKGDKTDPEGQMLAAMLAAQAINNNAQIIYGAYLIGGNWYFSLLDGNKYAIAEALLITRPNELKQLLFMLRKLKNYIVEQL